MKTLLVLVLLLFGINVADAQPQESIRIADKFTDGISDLSINSIIEDSYGFIWLATRDGLSRFDGDFHNYYSSFEDSTSLSNSYILHVLEDSKGIIWVGTYGGGLFTYDRRTDQFEAISNSNSDTIVLHGNHHFMIEDQNRSIWTATGNGVYVINANTKMVEAHYLADHLIGELKEDDEGNIWIGGKNLWLYNRIEQKIISTDDTEYFIAPFEERIIQDIIQDEQNQLWLVCRDLGLLKVKKNATKQYEFILEKKENPILKQISSNIMSIIPDGPWIWLGTENDGVYRYLKPTKNESADLIKVKGTGGNTYWSMIKDSSGRIWLGTYEKGIEIIDPLAHDFVHLPIVDENEEELGVEGIVIDQKDNLILATGGNGIMIKDLNYETISSISAQSRPNLKNNNLTSIYLNTKNQLFIGTWEGGLSILDRNNNKIQTYLHKDEDSNSIIENEVMAIAFDPVNTNVIWIGTWYGGLDRLDLNSDSFYNINSDHSDTLPHISSQDITDVLFDKDQNLWVATSNGLNKLEFDNNRNVINIEKYYQSSKKGLSANYLSFLFLDRKNQLWVGTHSEGLNRYDPATDSFIRYTQKKHKLNGLAAMTEDDEGNYWISSNGGISKFTPNQEPHWQNFDETHGIKSKNFRLGSVGNFSDGRIAFGAQNGIQIFNPKKIRANPIGPRVHLTSFKLFNQIIDYRDSTQTILNQSFLTTDSIFLNYDQDNFSIQYTSLGFTKPEHNTFAYQLEGIDPEWKFVGSSKSANYTSIPSGTYIFKVKACNSDGIWSEQERTLYISVGYAWWDTPFFRLSLIIGTILIIVYFLYNREKAHARYQLQLEQMVQTRTEQIQEQQKIIEQRALDLAEKNEHISKQHEELQTYVDALNEINDQLEKRVDLRTAKLREINDKLSKVAYMNSHELRKPLSNILGLINLIEELPSKDQREPCIEMLKAQAKEMDEKVRAMQENLHDYKEREKD